MRKNRNLVGIGKMSITSPRLETFFATLRKVSGCYDTETDFTTDWDLFKASLLSGITSLDTAITSGTITWLADENRAEIAFTKAPTVPKRLVEFELMLLWQNTSDLLQIVGMTSEDVKYTEKLLQCSMGVKLAKIEEKYKTYQSKWKPYDVTVDSDSSLINKLSFEQRRQVKKVWKNLRKVSTSNDVKGFLCEIDASTDWTLSSASEQKVMQAIFKAVRSTLGVFYLNDTAQFKSEYLSCNLPSGPTLPFSNESFDVGLVKKAIRWSPYQLCKYAEVNPALKADIEAKAGIVFPATNFVTILDTDENNWKLQEYAVSESKDLTNIPTDICTAYNTNYPTHLMYDSTALITSSTQAHLATAVDTKILPITFRNDNASVLYLLSDLAVSLDFNPFENVETESESKLMATWIVVIIVVLLIVLIVVTYLIWGRSNKKPSSMN